MIRTFDSTNQRNRSTWQQKYGMSSVSEERERKDWTLPVSCLTIILLSLVDPYSPLFDLLGLTTITNMLQQQRRLAFPAASSLMAWSIMLLRNRVKLTWISLSQTHPWATVIDTGSVSLFLPITQGVVANFVYQLLDQGTPLPPISIWYWHARALH